MIRRMILVLVLLLLPLSVSAHATLVSSNPEDGAVLEVAPSEVVLTFDDELEPEGVSLTVTNAAGNVVDAGDGAVDLADVTHKTMRVSLPSDLAADTYSVTWSVIGDDGHEVGGSISFTVAQPDDVVAASDAAVPPAAPLPATGATAAPIVWLLALALGMLWIGWAVRRRQTT